MVFKYLKENGESTLGAIVIGTALTESEVKLALEESVKSNHILFNAGSGKYKIIRILNPPLTEEEKKKSVAWDYTKIKEKLAGDGALPRSSAIPRQWRNPYLSYLPDRIDQGERGTCFAGRTRILMENFDYRPIKDIKSGEFVITHGGRVKRVSEVMKRKWQGNMIKMKVYGVHREIEATLEHPILTDDGWKPLGEITTSNYVAIPRMNNIVRDTRVFTFEDDPDFLWVLGMYLAEGNLDARRVTFSLGSHECEYAERIRSTMEKYGALSHSVINQEHHTIHLHISGDFWVGVFRELGGELCATKRISDRMMIIDPSLQRYIFDGWICGDGHIRKTGNAVCGVSTSEKLIMQMQHILLRAGLRGGVQTRSHQEGRLESFNLEYSRTQENLRGYFDENYYYAKVRSIEKIPQYMGEHVYNLEVEDDHSYIAETVAVHNCVGFSAAIGATLLYYALTQDLPSPAEVAAEKRNVEYDLGCPNNKPFLCDEFNVRWKSPQYIYQMSRAIGNVTDPEGSYVSDAAKSLNTYGSVFETDCKTAKTPYCVASWYPTLEGESQDDAKARIMLIGNTHLTEGYAQVTTFDDLCDAVYTHGFALIPINIYSNYTSEGYAGRYPDPNGDVVGSHAQCVVGYDLDARTLEFRQSWGTAWTNDGGISEKYFDEGAGAAFVILDEHETAIAHLLYTRVSLAPNVPCTYKVDGGKITATDNVVVLERGLQHTVVATPVTPDAVVQPSLSVTITPTTDATTVSFEFTSVTPPVVKKSLTDLIIEFFEAVIAIFLKKS
jgi:hypothetical protein